MAKHSAKTHKIPIAEIQLSRPLVFTLILLIILAVFIRWSLNPSLEIISADQSTQFSAANAKQMLSEILLDEEPHPLDSLEIRKTEKRLVRKIRSLGYQEEIQETQVCNDYKRWGVRCTQVRNIIVTIQGYEDAQLAEQPTGILLSSHYDSVDVSPGASDAGVAVATQLETLRLLSNLPKPRNTIVMLFNEGEEYGLFGAHAFMQQHPLAKQLKLAINVEARGSKGSSVMFESGENSGWLVQEYLTHSPKVFSSSLFYEVYKSLPNDTDLTVFKEHGLLGLNFAHAEKLTHYHTPLDNLANLELATIQHHGDNVWGVLNAIKDKDLNDKELSENNLVYTDILGLFSLQWQESTSLILSALLLLLFVLAFYRISKLFELSKQSIKHGVYSFFSLLIILPLMAYLLQLTVSYLSQTNTPWLTNTLPMQLALGSLLTLMCVKIGGFLLKSSQPFSVFVGQVICWVVLSLASSYFIVGISYLFILPSIVSIFLLLIYPFIYNDLNQSKLKLHYVLIALVVAIMFMPIVYTLEIMVTYQMSVALGIMLAFGLTGLLPVLSNKADINLKNITRPLFLVLLVGTSWTIIQPSFDDISKQRMNLFYVQDDKTGDFIAAGNENNMPSDSLLRTFNNPSLDIVFPWSKASLYQQPVEVKPKLGSQLDIKKIEQQNQSIQLLLSSTDNLSSLRAIRIFIKEDSNIKQVTFFGKNYDIKKREANPNGYIELRCIGNSCKRLELSILKGNQQSTELMIVQTLHGIPNELSHFSVNRGETAHQSQYGDRSFIVSRIEL